jgi:hypothetical protein
MKEGTLKITHLVFGFFTGAIASYMLSSYFYISNEATFMLIIFNFLFVSLTFPLDGALTIKLSMLLMGNVIGLVSNYLFSSFTSVIAYNFGEIVNTLYLIMNPFINLVWIVSFWSISLTALASSKNRKLRALV